MKNSTLNLSRIVLLLVALCLPGCAVMTVDVDVYKGPLSNHTEIQTEQVATMAISSRPLLGRLRFELEKYHRKNVVNRFTWNSDFSEKLERLKDSFVFEGDVVFASEQASLVNKLLAAFTTPEEEMSLRDSRIAGRTPSVETLKNAEASFSLAPEMVLARGASTPGLEYLLWKHEQAWRLWNVDLSNLSDDEYEKRSDLLLAAQEELQTSLIRFAQHVLHAANHEALFTDMDGLVPGGYNRVHSTLFGGPAYVDDAYVRVLQAIGNSILAQIDAIKQEDTHTRRLEDDAASERIAATQFENMTAPAALEHLLGVLKSGVELDADKLKEKLATAKGVVPEKETALDTAGAAFDLPPDTTVDKALATAGTEGEAAQKASVEADRVLTFLDQSNEAKALIATLFGEPAAPIKGSQLIVKFHDAARREAGKATEPVEWRTVRDVFEQIVKDQADPPANAPDVPQDEGQPKLLEVVKAHKVAMEGEFKKAEALAAAAKAVTAAKDDVAKAEKLLEQRQAFDHVSSKRDDILKLATTQPAYASVLSTARLILEKDRQAKAASSAANDKDEAGRLQKTLDRLAGMSPPTSLLGTMSRRRERATYTSSSKAVLDDMITLLRYERLNALKSNEPDSTVVERLETAIKAAELQRTIMIHIRPASAYLRTSFAASTLQPDAKLGWKNMLGQHAMRNITLGMFEGSSSNLKALVEIDKQYWQNVNTIRVAGMGNTNYVLAKDDVGNWYLKNYEADPKPIIDSARNLAMFAYSGGLGPAAVAQTVRNARVQDAIRIAREQGHSEAEVQRRADAARAVPTTTPEIQLSLAQKRYDEQTDTDYTSVRTNLNELATKIKVAWGSIESLKADLTELNKSIDAAHASMLKVVPDQAIKAPNTKSGELLKMFRAARNFHLEATSKITEEYIKKAQVPEADASSITNRKAKALKALNGVLQTSILEHHAKRLEMVKQFQIEVSLIQEGQAASQSSTK